FPLGDEIDEDPEERQDDHEERPTGLRPAADVVTAEQVAEHGKEEPEEQNPGEEDNHRPHHLAECVRKQHCFLLDRSCTADVTERSHRAAWCPTSPVVVTSSSVSPRSDTR